MVTIYDLWQFCVSKIILGPVCYILLHLPKFWSLQTSFWIDGVSFEGWEFSRLIPMEFSQSHSKPSFLKSIMKSEKTIPKHVYVCREIGLIWVAMHTLNMEISGNVLNHWSLENMTTYHQASSKIQPSIPHVFQHFRRLFPNELLRL